MIHWESGPDIVADQVDPSWQQPSLMAESPQRDKAPCNTTKTGRSPQGVDLASNFPRTQDKKISARRAGRSPIQGGSTSQATGLKGSGTRDHRTPPVSCFHALMDQSPAWSMPRPWIIRLFPEHPVVAQLCWDLGNLEAILTHWASSMFLLDTLEQFLQCCCPAAVNKWWSWPLFASLALLCCLDTSAQRSRDLHREHIQATCLKVSL